VLWASPAGRGGPARARRAGAGECGAAGWASARAPGTITLAGCPGGSGKRVAIAPGACETRPGGCCWPTSRPGRSTTDHRALAIGGVAGHQLNRGRGRPLGLVTQRTRSPGRSVTRARPIPVAATGAGPSWPLFLGGGGMRLARRHGCARCGNRSWGIVPPGTKVSGAIATAGRAVLHRVGDPGPQPRWPQGKPRRSTPRVRTQNRATQRMASP